MNKLIRDNVPKIIAKNNQLPITHIANDIEFWIKLKEKLQEEAKEYFNSENIEELADLLEVIYTIAKNKNIPIKTIEKLRQEKLIKNGGFKKKLILESVKSGQLTR